MRKTVPLVRLVRAAAIGMSLLGALGVSACQSLGLEEGEPTVANMPANLSVDPFLWQGALDTLNFLPLASTDPAAGKIETGWGHVEGAPANEQVRASVQLYPGTVSAGSVVVTVYRQVNGQPANVNPTTATTVQDAILLRTRQIKTAIQQDE